MAPLNTNPRWPEGFVVALREAGAQEKMIPFLLTWVRRFFAWFPGRSRRDLGRVEIEAFLSEMARRKDISNWQIAQARDALELYYEQFSGIALEPRPDDVLPITPLPTSVVPSREQDSAVAADRLLIREPTAELSARYQSQRAPVKEVSRQVQLSVRVHVEKYTPRFLEGIRREGGVLKTSSLHGRRSTEGGCLSVSSEAGGYTLSHLVRLFSDGNLLKTTFFEFLKKKQQAVAVLVVLQTHAAGE